MGMGYLCNFIVTRVNTFIYYIVGTCQGSGLLFLLMFYLFVYYLLLLLL